MTKKWSDNVIPKKDRKEFQSDGESDTYSYEDEYISLEEHKKVSSLIN